MDVAYKQHANQARRKNRSTTNLQHLSLAPLTSRFPLTDPEELPDFGAASFQHQHNVSYLQGKSAPTTPRLLQSPSHTRANSPSRRRRPSAHDISDAKLPKSKSTTHLAVSNAKRAGLGSFSPLPHHHASSDARGRGDSDWMLRTGALISSETRESKGQAWLVSRQSSTSLTGMRDVDDEVYERELVRERELASRRGSRRGSVASADDDVYSPNSRYGSRSQSRAGSRSHLRTPIERHAHDGYFSQEVPAEEFIQGPDFVSLDEKLEAFEVDTSKSDEAVVRKLVNGKNGGMSSWMWSLFSVEENDEESDNADGESDGETEGSHLPRSASTADFERVLNIPEERIPPPKLDEGGWQDAAWLLSVASKVLL
ncbi:uncharacterized protein F4807DRAFT_423438 [Annulohypoxylon truncatum]|uniref:uncharacterized protein n=1 Tax=Annulohypoxylon truncatum TaxID=327061 RepID=UPI0020080FB5|nr:uncharacterized protein F4807DRAFT_423438 [Annulohypoxylon truncatum]KAI1210446.1 hypothetical protein F4807DRAFT_423438 [Annulohypoxylon truncatum]